MMTLLSVFHLSRFERLIRHDAEERLSWHSGKRVRFVEVALELEQRKPVQILRIQPFALSFDQEGRVDQSEQEKEQRLIAEVISTPLTKKEPDNIIDAQHHFAKKHLDHRYRWTLAPEIEEAILKAIFS